MSRRFVGEQSFAAAVILDAPLFDPLPYTLESVPGHDRTEADLFPPEHVRRYSEGFKIETPTYSHGIVDIDTLIDLVKTGVAENYRWRGHLNNHHAHWKHEWYVGHSLFNYKRARLYERFVNLAVNRVRLPIEFHNFIHGITLPVEPPDEDVMEYQIQGWETAKRLHMRFNRASATIHHRRNRAVSFARESSGNEDMVDHAAHEWYQHMIRRHFNGVDGQVRGLSKIPKEFQYIDPEAVGTIADTPDPSMIEPEIITTLFKQVEWIGKTAMYGGRHVSFAHTVN